MDIKDISSPEAMEAAREFVTKYAEGKITKRTLPNTGATFDEIKALNSFKAGCNSNVMRDAASKAYDE